jgi:dienelactone hydrolase
MRYVDYLFCILSGRIGGIAGIAVAAGTIGLAFVVSRRKLAQQGCRLPGIIVGGSLLSAALAAPYVLTASRSETARGHFEVQQAIVVLPSLGSDRFPAPILTQIWFPVKGAPGQTSTLESCSQLVSLPLADGGNPRRLLLYMPHFGSLRNDNAARLSYLASYGYIAIAFDDIAQDAAPLGATREEEEVRLRMWHVVTQEDFETTLRLNDIRVWRQAEKALGGLDRLAACAAARVGSPWNNTVDYAHVGFLGYSFGGSTAAEAAVMDHRVIAVVNLDGNLFGHALAGGLAAPYLYVMSDRPVMTLSSMMSKDPNERYGSRIDARDRHEQARLAARKGSAGIRIKGSVHASLSDAALEPHVSRLWLLDNPVVVSNAVNLYTRDFFDVHLRGQKATLIDQRNSKVPLVQTFEEIGVTPDRNFPVPPLQGANEMTMP